MTRAEKNQPIELAGMVVRPGERRSVRLPVADLYTGTSLSMPVEVVCGRRKGPVLAVCAAIHGDELNGVEIIRRLLKRKSLKSLRGTLLAIPVVNVHGFLDQSRYLPDRRDLNRCFPGSARGSIASRTAHTFMGEIIERSDVAIDLHTGAVNRPNLPQIRADLDQPGVAELAEAFGTPVVLDSRLREGSLRQCAAERGLPMLLYEAGEALRFDDFSIRAGLAGVIQTMRFLGMLPPAKKQKAAVVPVIAESSRWLRAQTSGIVSRKAELGERVKKDQRIAVIGDPLGHGDEPVLAEFDGIVIGRSTLPVAHEGDALFHIAEFERIARVEDSVEDFTAEHTE